MPIIRWRPFEEIERLFDEDLRRFGGDLAVDMYEDNGNVIVEMNVAGIDPEKIDIDVEDHYLRISGSREEEVEIKEKNYYRKEIKRGSFERVVQLPIDVDISKAMAETKNGILRIRLPKREPSQSGKIKVAKK